jgi:hypothetical protein
MTVLIPWTGGWVGGHLLGHAVYYSLTIRI